MHASDPTERADANTFTTNTFTTPRIFSHYTCNGHNLLTHSLPSAVNFIRIYDITEIVKNQILRLETMQLAIQLQETSQIRSLWTFNIHFKYASSNITHFPIVWKRLKSGHFTNYENTHEYRKNAVILASCKRCKFLDRLNLTFWSHPLSHSSLTSVNTVTHAMGSCKLWCLKIWSNSHRHAFGYFRGFRLSTSWRSHTQIVSP
jgi:hypothetical protein